MPHCFCLFHFVTRGNEWERLGNVEKKSKKKKIEKKVEAAKKEQVERERMEHVCLTRAIYIQPLALREPIIEKF